MRKIAAYIFLLLIWAEASAQVHFDADFESGSLGQVKLLNSYRGYSSGRLATHLYYRIEGNYDPRNPVDTKLFPSANWYYFRMTGTAGKHLHLTFPNNTVAGSSYSYDGQEWSHFTMSESDMTHINKYFDCDTVFLALYKPYTYSYLQERLQEWTARPCVELDTIGFSCEGRPLQMLHITDPEVPSEGKSRIWVHGRTHPSETPGSFLVDGLVEYLTEDSPHGEALRRQIDAYILPFSNPDGVYDGRSRSNAIGINQEINYDRGDDSTTVEVQAIKSMFKRLTADRPLDFMLNSHSQLLACSCFWLHRSSSTSLDFLRRQWAFAGLVCSQNPCIAPREMRFSEALPRYPEGWFWQHAGDKTMALTVETPHFYYNLNSRGLWVDDDNLRFFGKRILQAMAEYLGMSIPGRIMVDTPSEIEEGWTEYRSPDRSFLGDCAWEALEAGAVVNYSLDSLKWGKYDVYRFVPGDCLETDDNLRTRRGWTDPGVHGWVYRETVLQEATGPFSYSFTAEEAGDLADALLIVRVED